MNKIPDGSPFPVWGLLVIAVVVIAVIGIGGSLLANRLFT